LTNGTVFHLAVVYLLHYTSDVSWPAASLYVLGRTCPPARPRRRRNGHL